VRTSGAGTVVVSVVVVGGGVVVVVGPAVVGPAVVVPVVVWAGEGSAVGGAGTVVTSEAGGEASAGTLVVWSVEVVAADATPAETDAASTAKSERRVAVSVRLSIAVNFRAGS